MSLYKQNQFRDQHINRFWKQQLAAVLNVIKDHVITLPQFFFFFFLNSNTFTPLNSCQTNTTSTTLMQSWRYYIRTGKQQQKTSDDQDITALAVNTQNIMLVFELTEFFLLKTSKLWKSEKLKSKPHQWIWVSQIRHSVSVSHWEETHKDLISHSTVKKSCWSGISIPSSAAGQNRN